MANGKAPNTGTQTKTRAVTNTALGVAVAFLGISAIAAGFVGSRYSRVAPCKSNDTFYVAAGDENVCIGETYVYGFNQDYPSAAFRILDFNSTKMSLMQYDWGGNLRSGNVIYLTKGKEYKKTLADNKYLLKLRFDGMTKAQKDGKTKLVGKLYISISEASFCKDTDGGKNFEEYGEITTNTTTAHDVCLYQNKYLKEYYCYGDGAYNFTYEICPNGCMDGACISGPEMTIVKSADFSDGILLAGNDVLLGEYSVHVGNTEAACLQQLVLEIESSVDLPIFLGSLNVVDGDGNKGNFTGVNTVEMNYCLEKDSVGKIQIVADVKSFTQSGALTTQIGPFTYEGQSSGIEKTSNEKVKGQTLTFEAASSGAVVYFSEAEDSPGNRILAAGQEVTLGAINFSAVSTTAPVSTEDVEIDYLYLTQNVYDSNTSYKDVDQIWFEDEYGNEIAGTRMTPTNDKPKIEFANDAFVVEKNDTNGQTLYLKAKLANIGPGYNGTAGNYIQYRIYNGDDVAALGNVSGSQADADGNFYGKRSYLFKGYPVISKGNLSTHQLQNGTVDLLKFSVSATESDIALNRLGFEIKFNGCNLSNLYLYDVTNPGNEFPVNDTPGYVSGGTWKTDGSDWTTNYDFMEIEISKNQPKTYVLRANVMGATPGAYISSKLAYPGSQFPRPLNVASSFSAYNFVWSDMSSSGHSIHTTDWTVSSLVEGGTPMDGLSY